MPTALIGERLPAFAPLATISAIRSGLRPYRAPIAIATGTISATDAIAPGPSVDTTRAIAEHSDRSGTQPRAPARQPHRAVRRSGGPRRAVSDARQREQQRHAGERRGQQSGGGNPAATASGVRPPMKTPTPTPGPWPPAPTLSRVVQPRTMARDERQQRSDRRCQHEAQLNSQLSAVGYQRSSVGRSSVFSLRVFGHGGGASTGPALMNCSRKSTGDISCHDIASLVR